MEKVVEYIVKQLAEFPEKVSVVALEENGTTVLKVSVDEADMGKVIGKHGKIAQAIRTIVKSVSMKAGKRYNVQIESLVKAE